jgi:putative ABC transport system substrate-binding protein
VVVANGCGLLPFAAQPRVARIGWSWSGAPVSAAQADAFRAGLRDAGWLEGQNLVIDERHYEDHPEHMSDLTAELLALKPDVLTGGLVPTVAFKQATHSIPIVMQGVADPVGLGLIASYARPGGNVTAAGQPVVHLRASNLSF